MKKNTLKFVLTAVFFIAAIAFLATFGKAALLKSYVYTGIGSCRSIPVLCKTPDVKINVPSISDEYRAQLIPYALKDTQISLPAGFTVIEGEIRKAYYRQAHRPERGSVVYLLYKKPNFFIELFPDVVRDGVNNDYDFISRLRYARPENITNASDAFFVVMKSVFTPDLGDQKTIRVAQFVSADKKGFLSYNLGAGENYFDCEIINARGDFFKVYIKDKARALDLDKVFTIISTVRHP